MIPAEIQKTLLGGSLDLIAKVGIESWFLYCYLRTGYEYLDPDWEIDSDIADGDALVCAVDFSDWRHPELIGGGDVVRGSLITLRASDWIYDWKMEEDLVMAVVGYYGDHVVYALDDLVNKDRLIQLEVREAPTPTPSVDVSARRSEILKTFSKQKEESDRVRDRNVSRRLAKLQERWAERYGYTGDDWGDPRWRDEDSPFGVRMNLEGLWHLYEELFEREFGRKSSLYTRGKPNKAAFRLKAVADEYDIETAMSAVVYAVDNWEEIQKLTRMAKPPAPNVIWQLRHELCHPLTQGDDPIEELRKVKGGSKDKLKKNLKKDEYNPTGNEKEVGW